MRQLLLIEDDLAVSQVVQAALEDGGEWQVNCVLDAEAAHTAVLQGMPDAAIVDVTAYHGSGLALAKGLVGIGVPVLMMTGEPDHMRRLDDAGCRFLKKPFRLAVLESEVGLLIDDARSRLADLARALDHVERERRGVGLQPRAVEAVRLLAAKPTDALAAPVVTAAMQAIFADIIRAGMSVTGAEMGTLQLLDASGVLRIVASHGFERPFLDFFALVHSDGSSACGQALWQGQRIIVPDLASSQIFVGKRSGRIMSEAGVRSVQSTPIVGRNGRLVGMISTHRPVVWQLDHSQLAALDGLVQRAVPEFAA